MIITGRQVSQQILTLTRVTTLVWAVYSSKFTKFVMLLCKYINKSGCGLDYSLEQQTLKNIQYSTSTIQVQVQNSTVQAVQYKYSTAQYSIVHYITVQYSTVQYSTVQYNTVQYSTVTVQVQYSTVQYSMIQYTIAVFCPGYLEWWLDSTCIQCCLSSIYLILSQQPIYVLSERWLKGG